MLEVGGVERPGRPHDDRRLLLAAGRRDLRESGPQQRRVVVDRPHPVVREQAGEQSRHRDAVLEHVRDTARRAHVVLEHLPRTFAVTHQVAAAHVAVDPARRPDPVRGAREPRARHDQVPRHEPLVDDLAPVVDVVDEVVQRPDALRQAALDRRPLGRGDDARHEVERERAVADRVVGSSGPAASKVMPCCMKIASRRRPAAASASDPSAASASTSVRACARGAPPSSSISS